MNVRKVDPATIRLLTECKEILGAVAHPDLSLEHKSMALQVESKRLLSPPDSDRGGVCIFLQPGMASAEGITRAVETTLPPEELHITLAYFGMLGQIRKELTFSRILGWAETMAEYHGPFFARLNGIARFNGEEGDAVVLNVDAKEIEDIRSHFMNLFGDYVNRSHGYTPHMTIGYLDPESDMHIQRTPPIDDVFIEYITVAYGGQYVRVKLNKPKDKEIHSVGEKSRKPRNRQNRRGY